MNIRLPIVLAFTHYKFNFVASPVHATHLVTRTTETFEIKVNCTGLHELMTNMKATRENKLQVRAMITFL